MNSVRGTYDLYGMESRIHNYVVKNLTDITVRYNFEQIKTPIFEHTELFKRSSGEASDIVQKEMYEFADKGGRSLTLRPELTAGTVRAFITNKIYGERLPQYKFFYYGEAFRYERPQSGRYRQFYQFGVEFIGENSIYSDVEVIQLAQQILENLNLKKSVVLKINTIGTAKERKKYNDELKKYFEKFKEELCEDCLSRLEKNPLRILDCKIDSNLECIQKAPKLKDYLEEESLEKYQSILNLLDDLKIKYEKDDTLVRGLDYYNDIVFEFVYQFKDNSKTLIGGGRYDSLIEELGGPKLPAVGFGAGIERIIEAFKEQNPDYEEDFAQQVDIYYIPLVEEANQIILKSMSKLRKEGIICQSNYSLRSLKSSFKQAEKNQAVFTVIIGEEEIKNNKVKVKNLISKKEEFIPLEDFENSILDMEE